MVVQLVWFKKDLRVNDHAPLTRACQSGPVLCVYVVEPEIIFNDEFDSSHQVFINECLDELHQRLIRLENGLLILQGNLPEVFDRLHSVVPFEIVNASSSAGRVPSS